MIYKQTNLGTLSSNNAQNLPFDVLQEIFEQYVPFHEDTTVVRCTRDLLRLCQICTSWRHAALNTTSIWTLATFTLHTIRRVGPPFTLYIHPKASMFMSWWKIHLSNVAPSIYLARPPRVRSPPPMNIEIDNLEEAYTTFFGGVFFRSARSLVLDILNHELDVICSDPTPFPNLIDIRIENNPNSRMLRIPVAPFPYAPKLTRLHLSHADLFRDRIIHIFPWAQLTHLYMPRTISQDTFRDVLGLCTHLRLGALILATPIPLSGIASVATAVQNVAVVPELRHLVVASSAKPVGLTFSGLSFPALVALRISSAAFPLHSLAQVCALLSAAPVLEELHFSNSLSFSDGDYIDFDRGDAMGANRLSKLAPRLRFLVVDFIDPSRLNVGKNIIRFLQSSWLSAGWSLPATINGSRSLRQLIFVVENGSLTESEPIPDEIIGEVQTFLGTDWYNPNAPFVVSVQGAYSFEERYIFDVFDENLPSLGWDAAVDFYTKL